MRPLLVANPHAPALTFLDSTTRTRRDHAKYLKLIRSIALLHQYQRPVRTVEHQGRALRYVEVSAQDIVLANRLADEVLGRTLDELPPQRGGCWGCSKRWSRRPARSCSSGGGTTGSRGGR